MIRSARLLLLVLVGIAGGLSTAAPASAHAGLIAANPAPGSIIGVSPTEVVISFSEPVTAVAQAVVVLSPDNKRISGAATTRGAVLHIPVRRADQPLGTYLVSYRVISADNHPVGGAFTFSVGAPSAQPPQPVATGTHRSVTVATAVAHALGYAGLTLSVGPALLLALLWPRRRSRRGASVLCRVGLGLIAAATAGALWTQAPAASGAALWDTSATELGQVATSGFGLILLARLGLLAIIAGLVGPALRGMATRVRAATLVVLAVAVLTTWPLTGHAAAAPLALAMVAAAVVHLAAMSVWLGGLITLTGFLLRGTHPRVLGVLLPVWSRWAAICVVWLVAAGTVQAVVQVGSVGALWHTGYGRLLLGKIAIVSATLAAAAYARRLVGRTRDEEAHGTAAINRVAIDGGRGDGVGLARLRRTVVAEVLGTVVVLGLSAVLVQVNPGRAAERGPAAAAARGVSQTLTCPLFTLQFNVFPVQVGENNTIHAFVYTPAGAPLPAQQWTVTSHLLGDADLQAVRQPLLALQPRHHAAGAITFPFPGRYEVRFTVRTSDVDEATVSTTIVVPAGPDAAASGPAS